MHGNGPASGKQEQKVEVEVETEVGAVRRHGARASRGCAETSNQHAPNTLFVYPINTPPNQVYPMFV